MKLLHFFIFLNFLLFNEWKINADDANDATCVPKYFNSTSFVCVCNETYCDSFNDDDDLKPKPSNIITIFESDQLKYRLRKTENHFEKHNYYYYYNYHNGDGQSIFINRNKTFQTIYGFGAAFTDATGLNILKLGKKLSEKIIENYYGKNGLRYSMGRIPIGGTDFSSRPYTYDDSDKDDFNLTNFKLAQEDFKYKIPFVQYAKNITVHNEIKLFASPWSPPSWMKTNGQLNGEGHIKGNIDGVYYQAWADYLLKFLQSYKENGIDFWGMTIQNEPFDGSLPNFTFNCNGLTPEEERDFLFNTLGPLLQSNGFGVDKLKLMIVDDQRPFIENWANVVLSQQEQAKKFVSGIAFHWYLNTLTSPDVLDKVHEKYPDYFLLSTEACEGSSPFQENKVSLGEWGRAETYAYDILTDLLHHTNGWIDWNMALDLQGGPNWAKNFVDSPIIVNEDKQEFYKQPMYYALAHFTRFLDPGSIRITIETKQKFLDMVAFKNPINKAIILIVMNRFHDTIPLTIDDPQNGIFNTKVLGHSIQTLIWFD